MGGFKFKLQLYISSDASEVGYGTSAYLRVEDLTGVIYCSFVVGKARNAPVKFVSSPTGPVKLPIYLKSYQYT